MEKEKKIDWNITAIIIILIIGLISAGNILINLDSGMALFGLLLVFIGSLLFIKLLDEIIVFYNGGFTIKENFS